MGQGSGRQRAQGGARLSAGLGRSRGDRGTRGLPVAGARAIRLRT